MSRLGASNSCINPILYTFFNRKYKRGFIDLLRFGLCCGPSAGGDPNAILAGGAGAGTGVNGTQVAIANAMRGKQNRRAHANGSAIRMDTFGGHKGGGGVNKNHLNNRGLAGNHYNNNNNKSFPNNNNNNNRLNKNDTTNSINNNEDDTTTYPDSSAAAAARRLLLNGGSGGGSGGGGSQIVTQSTTEVTIATDSTLLPGGLLRSSTILNQPFELYLSSTGTGTGSTSRGSMNSGGRQQPQWRRRRCSSGNRTMTSMMMATDENYASGRARHRRLSEIVTRPGGAGYNHCVGMRPLGAHRGKGLAEPAGYVRTAASPLARGPRSSSRRGPEVGPTQSAGGRGGSAGRRRGSSSATNESAAATADYQAGQEQRLNSRRRQKQMNRVRSSRAAGATTRANLTDGRLNRPPSNNELPCQPSGPAAVAAAGPATSFSGRSDWQSSGRRCDDHANDEQPKTAVAVAPRPTRAKRRHALSRSLGGRSLKSNSTNTTRDTVSTDITALSLTTTTTGPTNELRGSNVSLVERPPLADQISGQPVSGSRGLQRLHSSTSLSSQNYDEYGDEEDVVDDDDDYEDDEEEDDYDQGQYLDLEDEEQFDDSGGDNEDVSGEVEGDIGEEEDEEEDEEEEEDEDEEDENLLFGSTNNSTEEDYADTDGDKNNNGQHNRRRGQRRNLTLALTPDHITRSLVASGSSLVNVVIHKLNSHSSLKSWSQAAHSELISMRPDVDTAGQQQMQTRARDKLAPARAAAATPEADGDGGSRLNNGGSPMMMTTSNHHQLRKVSMAGVDDNGCAAVAGAANRASSIVQHHPEVSEFIDSMPGNEGIERPPPPPPAAKVDHKSVVHLEQVHGNNLAHDLCVASVAKEPPDKMGRAAVAAAVDRHIDEQFNETRLPAAKRPLRQSNSGIVIHSNPISH